MQHNRCLCIEWDRLQSNGLNFHFYHYRRSGDYRLIYTVEDARLVVQVIRVGHRREVYR